MEIEMAGTEKLRIGLYILLAAAVGLYTACKQEAPVPAKRIHAAEKGVYNLTDSGFKAAQSVRLQGEWEWWWGRLLVPETDDKNGEPFPPSSGYFNMPGLWNGLSINGKELSGNGYATFRLIVTGLTPGGRYGIKLKEMDTAYEVWLDDNRLVVNGVVGKSKETSEPSWKRQYVFFTATDTEADIVLLMSNFHHRKGGPEEAIVFGTEERVGRYIQSRVTWEAFLGGGIGLIGLYHLILFLFRRKDRSPLLLALFCFTIVFRIFFTGEKLFLSVFPGIGWNLLIKFEYVNLFFLAPFIGAFYFTVYPGKMSKTPLYILHSISAVFIAVTILSPPKVFTYLAPVYQLVFLCFGLYVLYVLIRKTREGTGGSIILLIGTVLLLLFGVNDILYNNLIFPSFRLSPLGLPIGLFFFILAHAAFLARRFTAAYTTSEELSKTLELKVRERTAELMLEKEKLIHYAREDSLTGLYNRRYAFDLLEKEFSRFKRYGTSFSIIIFDLDHFKQVNDNYGHLSGDMVLRAFGKTVKELTREIDVAARFGGEEFIIILPETAGRDAAKVAEKIRVTFEEITFSDGDTDFICTCSAGIAEINGICGSINDIMKQADTALYRAKEEGRNRVLIA